MVEDEVVFFGHPNVRCFHARTIEITKHEHLSLRGDCIAGVRANKACSDLSDQLKNRLRRDESFVKLELVVENEVWLVGGKGHRELSLEHTADIVTRTSSFICPRTLCIACDSGSASIPRRLVQKLQSTQTRGLLRIIVE
ncbi:MAG: DUF371 domain-containing protein [Nitrososphaera sp.]